MEQNLHLLITRAIDGDDIAFGELIAPRLGTVYRICGRYMRNRADAEDCAVLAVTRIWTGLHTLRSFDAFDVFVAKVTANTCRNELRKRMREQEHVSGSLDAMFSDDYYEGSILKDPDANVEKTIIRNEDLAKLRFFITLLPEKLHTAVVLTQLEGVSYEDAARLECVPVGTIKSRVSRGIGKLAEWMVKST